MLPNKLDIQPEEPASALDVGTRSAVDTMTDEERRRIEKLGNAFAKHVGGVSLLISGKFTSANHERGTEGKIRDMLLDGFGYPKPRPNPKLTLHLLLDSPGGSLDAAYSTALYLSAYTNDLKVYVPDRAKSASTLLAIGARELYLSGFGELGPLDTQLHDPRNPAKFASALDCYQSVDYVRKFAITTIGEVLRSLIDKTEKEVPLGQLLDDAEKFALGAINPMLENVSALDFGGWGRSLRIGEHYTQRLLESQATIVDRELIKNIAHNLVYGYTHHPFPIDYHEAKRIELPVKLMDEKTYEKAIKVVEECDGRSFVGFLSRKQAQLHKMSEDRRRTAKRKRRARSIISHPRAEQPEER